MSSVDSSILSASSQFCWNIYRPFTGVKNPKQLKFVLRIGILVAGTLAALLALKVQSVYTLWFLCSDLVYVLLFPQLVMVLYDRKANAWGAITGLVVGFFFRIGGGEPALGLTPLLPYPIEPGEISTWFPFRTSSMLISLTSIWLVSRITQKHQDQSGRTEKYWEGN
jgi:high affinity choline transporter 7